MIEIEGLTKAYPDGTRALDRLDLVLETGMFGLLGPNGAGKTTFLSMLVLALEPTAGRLTFDGLDADRTRDRPGIRRLVGYLPQEFQPVPHLTGREYVTWCARLRLVPGSRRALASRVDQLLGAVGLLAAADRRAGTYSGGMKRRLGVAQALVHSPRLVVVDEPTAGLDPEERIAFRNLISEVAEVTAVVLSTHIVEDVEATCPRIGVIDRGRLVFVGPPAELMAGVAGRLWELPADAQIPAGCLHLSDRVGVGAAGTRQVVLGTAPVPGGRAVEPTLDDAYLALLTGSASG